MPDPFVFRHRMLLIGASFFASAGIGQALRGVEPFAGWTGIVSLPAPLLLGATGPAPPDAAWALLLPTLLVLGALLLRAWGTSYLRGHVMVDASIHTERLIVAGPFRWVRNPLYLGNVLFALGVGLFFPPPGAPLCVALMALMGWALAGAEERAMRRAHGDAYEAYAARVPRFLPRPPPADLPPGAAVQPDWRNGLMTEAWFLVLIVDFDLVALRVLRGAAVAAAVFVAFLVLRSWWTARARRAGA